MEQELHIILGAQKGKLLRILSKLFWLRQGWDNDTGQVHLILDACSSSAHMMIHAVTPNAVHPQLSAAFVTLLIDDKVRTVWVSEKDIEVIDESR